jgi:hypothetical protein
MKRAASKITSPAAAIPDDLSAPSRHHCPLGVNISSFANGALASIELHEANE